MLLVASISAHGVQIGGSVLACVETLSKYIHTLVKFITKLRKSKSRQPKLRLSQNPYSHIPDSQNCNNQNPDNKIL